MTRMKKHILGCAPETIKEMKQHLEYGKCFPTLTRNVMYELILRLEAIEEELE